MVLEVATRGGDGVDERGRRRKNEEARGKDQPTRERK